jgi:hypothetical protein
MGCFVHGTQYPRDACSRDASLRKSRGRAVTGMLRSGTHVRVPNITYGCLKQQADGLFRLYLPLWKQLPSQVKTYIELWCSNMTPQGRFPLFLSLKSLCRQVSQRDILTRKVGIANVIIVVQALTKNSHHLFLIVPLKAVMPQPFAP